MRGPLRGDSRKGEERGRDIRDGGVSWRGEGGEGVCSSDATL